MRKLLNTLILFVGLLLLSSCKANNAQTRDYTYFDTMIRITIYSNVDQKETFNKTNEILKDYHIITNRYEEEKLFKPCCINGTVFCGRYYYTCGFW